MYGDGFGQVSTPPWHPIRIEPPPGKKGTVMRIPKWAPEWPTSLTTVSMQIGGDDDFDQDRDGYAVKDTKGFPGNSVDGSLPGTGLLPGGDC